MNLLKIFSYGSAVAGLLWPLIAQGNGGITLTKTRLIFNEADKALTLTVKNNGGKSWLIQSRSLLALDGADAAASFIVTPPLFVLRAGKEQTLRIMRKDLPPGRDRESLFYLSVKAIPASQQSDAAAQVAAGVRFNLKLFYRPAALPAASDLPACNLRFVRRGKDLSLSNPSPYFVTLGTLALDGQPWQPAAPPLMLPPSGTQTLSAAGAARQVTWQAINDHGGLSASCQVDTFSTEAS